MPDRNPDSYKGQNGKVAVIGGSTKYHGAPIFSALSAEHSGVDLIFPYVAKCHLEVTKNSSLNFICKSFQEDHLRPDDVTGILELLANCHAVVIGPGLDNHPETKAALELLIPQISICTVIDGNALAVMPELAAKNTKMPAELVLTPHRGEFASFTNLPEWDLQQNVELLVPWAKKLGATFVLKGRKAIIVDKNGNHALNNTGNAGLTVGGSGDVLAGLIAGLMAQGQSPFEAAKLGTEVVGAAGDLLYEDKGYAYRAVDVIEQIPMVLKRKAG